MPRMRKYAAGFSLIELMVVCAIIAILAAIALPSYRRYVVRAHRTEAQRALMDLAARQERAYYSHHKYLSLDELGANPSIAGNNYEVSLALRSSAAAYVITAAAIGNQQVNDPQCQSLTLTHVGVQGSTGTVPNDPACWSK